MTKKVPDISREVPCPKCGYNPDHPGREEYRNYALWHPERDELIVACFRCNYIWVMQPLDAEQPKVVRRWPIR